MTQFTEQQIVDVPKGTKPWYQYFVDLATYVKQHSADIANLQTGSPPGWGAPIDTRFSVTDVGTTNVINFTPAPAPVVGDALQSGQMWLVTPATNSTGPVTVKVGVLAAVVLKTENGSGVITDLAPGAIKKLRPFWIKFDGTQFLLSDPPIIDQANVAITGGAIASTAISGGTSSGAAVSTPTFTDTSNVIETHHTANGIHTYGTRSKHALLQIWGAGGSGAANDVAGQLASAGGGGGYTSKLITITTATATIVVGAGGVGVATNSNGNTGGTSSYTDGVSTLTALGGSGGNQVADVNGGTASGGTRIVYGGRGLQANNYIGGAGGAAAMMSNSTAGWGAGSVAVETGSSGAGGPGRAIITEYVI